VRPGYFLKIFSHFFYPFSKNFPLGTTKTGYVEKFVITRAGDFPKNLSPKGLTAIDVLPPFAGY
jgi:hypothetical protein